MNSIQKQLVLLFALSANILLPTSTVEIAMKDAHFIATNPGLVKQYNEACKAVALCPSYQECNKVEYALNTQHLQLISRMQALKHVWAGSLPLHNVVKNKLTITDFFENCERAPKLDTPQCKLYDQLANEYSEKHTQLEAQYKELKNTYQKSKEWLYLADVTKQVETEYTKQQRPTL